MGYGYYTVGPDNRPAGYYVLATCDKRGCDEEIDRGLGYLCGDTPHDEWSDEPGCGRYFCVNQEDVAREGVAMFDEHGHRRFGEWYDDGQPTANAWVTWWLETFAPRGFHSYMDDVTRIEWRYL